MGSPSFSTGNTMMGGAATGGTSNVTYQKTQKREKEKVSNGCRFIIP